MEKLCGANRVSWGQDSRESGQLVPWPQALGTGSWIQNYFPVQPCKLPLEEILPGLANYWPGLQGRGVYHKSFINPAEKIISCRIFFFFFPEMVFPTKIKINTPAPGQACL